eukprot:7497943-Alexandrium_andersonii.AAC.1
MDRRMRTHTHTRARPSSLRRRPPPAPSCSPLSPCQVLSNTLSYVRVWVPRVQVVKQHATHLASALAEGQRIVASYKTNEPGSLGWRAVSYSRCKLHV